MDLFFASNPHNFTTDSIPKLENKTFIVTGGNSGIGYATVQHLALNGAHVYLAARSEKRAAEAMERLQVEVPEGNITFLKLDLQDLHQVKEAAEEFLSKESVLDGLVNNAGIMASPFELSKDGIEAQFATNHLGHFLFTNLLIPALDKAESPRIVNVSSVAHKFAPSNGIEFENINNPDFYYSQASGNWARYGQSKLANILFTVELTRRFPKIYSNSVHPGGVNTELHRGPGKSSWLLGEIIRIGVGFLGLNTTEGAISSLFCATAPEIVEENIRDAYFVPLADQGSRSKLSKDKELAKKLWEFSESLMEEKLGSSVKTDAKKSSRNRK